MFGYSLRVGSSSVLQKIVDVTDWEVDLDESAGTDEKLWLRKPDSTERWLFKPVTEKNGHIQGEDWAEAMSTALAGVLGIPCAETRMAVRQERRGSVSRDLRIDRNWEMQPGWVILAAEIQDYIPGSENPRGRPGHSLQNIQGVLREALPPEGAPVPSWFSAFDLFAGYLVFDAWIANRDRHDENWSVLVPLKEGESNRLSPSYDHAGGLGYNVLDTRRSQLLGRPDGVLDWVRRGTAHRFEHQPDAGPPTLVDLAHRALDLAGTRTRDHWLTRLSEAVIVEAEICDAGWPNMSDPCRRFVSAILGLNRGRLLDDSR